MKLRVVLKSLGLAAGLGVLASPALAQLPPDHPGRGVYEKACAFCHDNPGDTRAASLQVLQGTTAANLRLTMTEGVMQPMAAALSPTEINDLVTWLTAGQNAAPASWTDAMMCPADQRTVDLSARPSLAMFNVDIAGSRHISAADAGIRTADFANLEQAWALGFPNTQAVSATPVVVGSTVFVSAPGRLMAVDADKGCAKWVHEGGASRSPLTYGKVDGVNAIIYPVGRDILAVNAQTGEQIWKASGQPRNGSGGQVRAAVVLHNDKIIVPLSASGVGGGGAYCCTGHGSVVALNAKDGSWLWEYHTMKEAEDNGQVNAQGQKQRGPSGAPIWSTPTIDVKRNRVLVTTGENTSWPATTTSDAVIALDLNTGEPAWIFQAMESDVWNMHCRSTLENSGPNCPWHFDENQIGRDFDFGGSAIVTRTKGGLFGIGAKDIVLAGQKSGHLWALDAATGKVLWSQQVGEGTALGGNHWGIAMAGTNVFLTIADSIPAPGQEMKPGVYAFRISDGKPVWSYAAKPDCGPERKPKVTNCETKYGFSATPMVVDGAVVAPTLDGKIYAFDAKTGAVLRIIDTIGPAMTTNGVEGKGGTIDSHAVAAGGGLLLVGSGYASFGQTAGNVLFAYRPKK